MFYEELAALPGLPRIGEFLYYKGFRVSQDTIQDTRFSDSYSPVEPSDLEVLRSMGIVKGGAYLMWLRDRRRVKTYTKRLEHNKKSLERFTQLHRENPTNSFYKKRKRNCEEAIEYLSELIQYHSSKALQSQQSFKFLNNE